MANGADALRSVNAILQGIERKEQREVDTALAFMQLAASQKESAARMSLAEKQFAQTSQLQNIQLVQSNLTLAGKSLEMEKPKIVNRFLQSTGIGGIYEEQVEGEPAEDAITSMAKRLRHKDYGKFTESEAMSVAGAVFNYYSAKDSDSLISLASNLHDAGVAIDAGVANKAQVKLFESFKRLGATADLRSIAEQAKKATTSEQNISREISEFLQGDYEIQSPIGVYADVPEAQALSQIPPPPPPPSGAAKNLSIEQTKEALSLAQTKRIALEKKMDTGTATEDEKEEYYQLPDLIERFRLELYEGTGELEGELNDEMTALAKDIEALKAAGLTGMEEFKRLKDTLQDRKIQQNRIVQSMRIEKEKERLDDIVEEASGATGIPESEIRAHQEAEEEDYRRRTSVPGRMR